MHTALHVHRIRCTLHYIYIALDVHHIACTPHYMYTTLHDVYILGYFIRVRLSFFREFDFQLFFTSISQRSRACACACACASKPASIARACLSPSKREEGGWDTRSEGGGSSVWPAHELWA